DLGLNAGAVLLGALPDRRRVTPPLFQQLVGVAAGVLDQLAARLLRLTDDAAGLLARRRDHGVGLLLGRGGDAQRLLLRLGDQLVRLRSGLAPLARRLAPRLVLDLVGLRPRPLGGLLRGGAQPFRLRDRVPDGAFGQRGGGLLLLGGGPQHA